MREDTTKLMQGVGKLRWGDSMSEVKNLFPRFRMTNTYEGRNPRTGERVFIPAGVLIPGFRQVNADVGLEAVVDFDADGISSIKLTSVPTVSTDEWGDVQWVRWSEHVAAAVEQLGGEFGFGPVSSELMEQEWNAHGCRVELFLESGEFTLTVHRPPRAPISLSRE